MRKILPQPPTEPISPLVHLIIVTRASNRHPLHHVSPSYAPELLQAALDGPLATVKLPPITRGCFKVKNIRGSKESLSRNTTNPERSSSLPARQEAPFRVSQAISVYRNPKELFRVLAKELRQVVDFDFVAIYLYDPVANKIHNALLETLQGPAFQIPADFRAEETTSPGGSTITRSLSSHLLRRCRNPLPRMMKHYEESGLQSTLASFPSPPRIAVSAAPRLRGSTTPTPIPPRKYALPLLGCRSGRARR